MNRMDFPQRDYREAILALIRSDASDEEIRLSLEEYHDSDIADAFDELSPEELERLLGIMGTEAMSEVVTYAEDAGEFLSALDAEDAAEIIEQMDADEAMEALDDLDEELRQEVLSKIEDEEIREELELLDSYDDDEFGSRMSTNFIAIPKSCTVKEAMRVLVAEAPENDNIYTLFLTDENGTFFGAMDLKDLIMARSTDSPAELASKTFPYVCDKEKIEENIERLSRYSEDLIPVLSEANGKLLGVLTAQQISELVEEEQDDDYAKLAALASEEDTDDNLLASMKKRIPWLSVLLVLGLAVSAVVGLFEGIVNELPMLVAFQSLILGMAGNVGTQSLAVTIQSMDDRRASDWRRIFKEVRIALLNGIALGLISFLIVLAYLSAFGRYELPFCLSAGGCVAAAMCFAMTVSGLVGAAIPLTLKKIGADPAVASGPLITTVNDLVAVLSYYGLAWLLLIRI